MSDQRPVVGIDLGGTKIVAALVSPSGRIMDRERAPTLAAEGPQSVVQRIFGVVDGLLKRAAMRPEDTGGICVAAAGPIDMREGRVKNAPNLPGWESVPLRDMVRDRFAIPSFLINDAKAAVLGESRFGAGQGVKNLLCITLGTGIGGGIMIDGKLYLGQSGAAGEVGHMTIDVNGPKCACGNTGCWETLASGTAMEREALRRLSRGEGSSLSRLTETGTKAISANEIAEAAREGDGLALGVIRWTADYVGVGLVNLVDIFNPEMIVMGGGLSKIGDMLLQPAIDIVRQRAFPLLSQAVRIVPSTIGDDAGVLGAAAFAFQAGAI